MHHSLSPPLRIQIPLENIRAYKNKVTQVAPEKPGALKSLVP